MPSDKYNLTASTSGSAYGYGLGHTSSTARSIDEEMAIPLTPFAGVDRRALIPSPVKATLQAQVNFSLGPMLLSARPRLAASAQEFLFSQSCCKAHEG